MSDSKKDGKERRKCKRQRVKVLITEVKGKTHFTHTTEDLSIGGVGVAPIKGSVAWEDAEYIFQLPNKTDYINLRGKLVYHKGEGNGPDKYGIEFIDPPPDIENKINNYIRREEEEEEKKPDKDKK